MPNAQAKAAAIKLGSDQVGDAEGASESRSIIIKLGSDQAGDADARRTPQHNKTW